MVKRRSTRTDFSSPKRVSNDDFGRLCSRYKLQGDARLAVRTRLNNFSDVISEWIKERKQTPDAKSDRHRMKVANSRLKQAIRAISKLGPSGSIGLAAAAN